MPYRPLLPALISRIHTSSSHRASHQFSRDRHRGDLHGSRLCACSAHRLAEIQGKLSEIQGRRHLKTEGQKLAEDKPQAVHQQLSQCQLGRDSEYVNVKASKGWKQAHTSERRFGAPAFGGGFFLARVIHRPSSAACSFKLQNASKALLLVLQGIKKPAVTRTSGQVMGELTIWPSF